MTETGVELELAVGVVVGRLSHDLKNPLAVVLSNLHYLHGLVTEGDRGAAIGESVQAAEQMAAMLDDIVDIQRIRAGTLVPKPVPTDLTEIVSRLRARLRGRVGSRRLDFKLPARTVTLDGRLLERALGAIVEHSLRQTPPRRAIRLRGTVQDDVLQLEVLDEGMPFSGDRPPSIVASTIDPRSPTEGCRSDQGLQLIFAGHAIRLMGGTITVSPREDGDGVAFAVRIPRA